MNLKHIAMLALGALALLGTLAGAKLSLAHLQHGEICPMIGSIPACIIVFFGYLLILIATIMISHKNSKMMFFVGWIPITGLASVGVILELTRGETCPVGGFGIPQCYYSFSIAVAVAGLFFLVRKSTLPTL